MENLREEIRVELVGKLEDEVSNEDWRYVKEIAEALEDLDNGMDLQDWENDHGWVDYFGYTCELEELMDEED